MANKENIQIDNKALKEALTTLKEERTVANEQKMFAELKKAYVLTPVVFSEPIQAKETGKYKLPKNTKIKYVLIHTKDGKAFFPAFTDLEEAKKLASAPGQTVQYIVRGIKDYDMLVNDPNNATLGIVLNPMSDNIVLPKDLVNRLNHGTTQAANGNAPVQEVRYGEPSVYPTALANAVYDVCCSLENVNKVYLKAMYVNMMMSYALFVDADKLDETTINAIKEAATKEAKGVEVVVQEMNKKILDTVIKDDVALYDKELEF